ncbi:hypothetical protein OMAG_000433 [Candidatus Omnitrophus magneticus]|uniref:Uncharacterized protein n=1 Tax=Candidatus Omnitrophus magneticus TaxID=1609969 RepID=A0A0F0CP78_9BACT|nr:hypothetical protein OMAG_002317 [Candidatus Omnitrophus magneticus]KJJ84660.1 hypothetical protein OMAG_001472 [Candidatus Omnitrophus magneticus]KJJ84695.1 hypothetical protein OMAG_001437 [Candidatus Omnitrophus magneticus]KJJ85698.1 hypothetical protein OMAG_000433 [Candidatus Omnitrophus magneticus]
MKKISFFLFFTRTQHVQKKAFLAVYNYSAPAKKAHAARGPFFFSQIPIAPPKKVIKTRPATTHRKLRRKYLVFCLLFLKIFYVAI